MGVSRCALAADKLHGIRPSALKLLLPLSCADTSPSAILCTHDAHLTVRWRAGLCGLASDSDRSSKPWPASLALRGWLRKLRFEGRGSLREVTLRRAYDRGLNRTPGPRSSETTNFACRHKSTYGSTSYHCLMSGAGRLLPATRGKSRTEPVAHRPEGERDEKTDLRRSACLRLDARRPGNCRCLDAGGGRPAIERLLITARIVRLRERLHPRHRCELHRPDAAGMLAGEGPSERTLDRSRPPQHQCPRRQLQRLLRRLQPHHQRRGRRADLARLLPLPERRLELYELTRARLPGRHLAVRGALAGPHRKRR